MVYPQGEKSKGLEKRTHILNGIEIDQLNYHGNWYTTVASKIKIAIQADPATIKKEKSGFHVVSSEFVQMGERWAYRIVIEYPLHSGIHTHGSDFIDMKASDGLAKAESSAYGRALALCGIAIESGIASAEEVEHSTTSNKTASNADTKPDNNTGSSFGTSSEVATLTLLAERFGLTLANIKMYATGKQLLWQRKTVIDLIEILSDHKNAFRIIAHVCKIPLDAFDMWVYSENHTWDMAYLYASNPRRQDFYNAVYPQKSNQQSLTSANIPNGSI